MPLGTYKKTRKSKQGIPSFLLSILLFWQLLWMNGLGEIRERKTDFWLDKAKKFHHFVLQTKYTRTHRDITLMYCHSTSIPLIPEAESILWILLPNRAFHNFWKFPNPTIFYLFIYFILLNNVDLAWQSISQFQSLRNPKINEFYTAGKRQLTDLKVLNFRSGTLSYLCLPQQLMWGTWEEKLLSNERASSYEEAKDQIETRSRKLRREKKKENN